MAPRQILHCQPCKTRPMCFLNRTHDVQQVDQVRTPVPGPMAFSTHIKVTWHATPACIRPKMGADIGFRVVCTQSRFAEEEQEN